MSVLSKTFPEVNLGCQDWLQNGRDQDGSNYGLSVNPGVLLLKPLTFWTWHTRDRCFCSAVKKRRIKDDQKQLIQWTWKFHFTSSSFSIGNNFRRSDLCLALQMCLMNMSSAPCSSFLWYRDSGPWRVIIFRQTCPVLTMLTYWSILPKRSLLGTTAIVPEKVFDGFMDNNILSHLISCAMAC